MTQTLSKTMKAVAIDRFGGIETLETQELPIPAVGADEVLVHVEAAGVGVWDPFEREGGFAKEFNIKPVFPLVLGSDGAGTVEAVGSQVKRFKKGDRVYGISFLNPKGGFYAQYAVVKETSLALIPGKLTMPQAAAMAVDAVTALAGLDTTLGLKDGESLLIFGASGGIGHLAVQFAKRMGARVLAVASGDDGVAFVRGLSADKVVDGHKEDVLAAARQFAPNGLDAVLLTTGGEAAEKSLAALRTGGRVAYPNGVQPVPKERAGIKCRIFRRSWPMTKKQYRTPKVSVGTVKKSIAAMASRWFLRNVSQRFTESGSLGARRIHRETLLSESSKPSLSSSP